MLSYNTENHLFLSIKYLITHFSIWIWYCLANLGHRPILQGSQHWKCLCSSFKTFCLTRYCSSSPFRLHFHVFLITFGTTPIITIWKSLNQTLCRDTDLQVGEFKSPFLSQMYLLSCENPRREHYFSLVLLSPVESSVNCTISSSLHPLPPRPLTVTSPHSTAWQGAGSCSGCLEQQACSVHHLYTEGGRKGKGFADTRAQRLDQTAVVPPLPRHRHGDHKRK